MSLSTITLRTLAGISVLRISRNLFLCLQSVPENPSVLPFAGQD